MFFCFFFFFKQKTAYEIGVRLVGSEMCIRDSLYDAWLMHDQLRAVFGLRDPVIANELLGAWVVWAERSGLAPFQKAAATIAKHFEGIIAAVRLGISNARLEAMNSTVRLMSHRSRGFRRLDSLVALMRLVCGKVPVALPT